MRVRLAYGEKGLEVEVPDNNVSILEPAFVEAVPDEVGAIKAAFRSPIASPPLRERVRPGSTVAIVFSDGTRPAPNRLMIPALLEEIEGLVPPERITLINALGMHRPNTREELVAMLGEEIVDNYRIAQHDANDKSTMASAGQLADGTEIWVNKEYLAADFRILTGFIEPHFFAGFSGGFKAVLPGIAARELILANHSAKNIAHPKATWAVLDGNPIQEMIRQAGMLTHPDFLLNTTLNRHKRVTAVFAGDVARAHRMGTEFVKKTALRRVDTLFDIVVTTNSGYPLDQNLYQTVKGMSAAAQIVKPGGTIIAASECRDGIPSHGNYKRILEMAESPRAMLDMILSPGFEMFDQWEAQIQAMVQLKADVYIKTSYLADDDIRKAHLKPVACVEDALAFALKKHGPQARIAVLPEGPQTVPYVG